jgi:beta-glucosidase
MKQLRREPTQGTGVPPCAAKRKHAGNRCVVLTVLAPALVLLCIQLFHLAACAQDSGPASKGPWMDKSLAPDRRADLLIEQMTLDEKLVFVHGKSEGAESMLPARWLGGAGFVPGIPRLGIPDLQMTDGRSGVVIERARYATALPSALAAASSWDLKLAYDYGALLGKEVRDLGFNVSLGGTANLIREPRNGRNFECWGEDPILIGKMLGRALKGTQDQGVIGNINRYAINDQETGRGHYSAHMDERSMRETDLLAFEVAIKESDVGTVMCAYNRVNGDYACENSHLLNEVLKGDWGYKGWVMSDWGATHSTVKAALAGFDQEQPGGRYFEDALKAAVEKGEVPKARLDDMVHRILRTEFALGVFDNPPLPRPVNPFSGAEVAQRVTEQSTVLLKNANGQLPLKASSIKSIAVIGSHADVGVLSGGGSDQVSAAGGNVVPDGPPAADGYVPVWHPSSPLKAIRAKAPAAKVVYDGGADFAAAARLAATSDVAIVFVNQHTQEGLDVPDLSLPDNQNQLVSQVAAANPQTIVVLETGGPVLMPWIDKVSAVLEAWYPGIRGGEALARILFDDVNPSGKLPVSFPKSEADLPDPVLQGPPGVQQKRRDQQLPFFDVNYPQALKNGYKWFDAEGKEPLFPFGFGLSYTTYSYSELKTRLGKETRVSFNVTNTGKRAGAEIVQVYVSLPPSVGEPPKRLVAWDKIRLAPGETRAVTLKIEPQYLSIFNTGKKDWELVPGDYTVLVGASSRNTPLAATVRIPGTR